jgi:serine/threonine-protein kinase
VQEDAPKALVALVETLGLATADQVQAMGRRVRRLARELPLFESVWVDALAQARTLTPFQAAEINAGRGPSLRVGPYVLCRRLPSPGYADCFLARDVTSRQTARLAVARVPEDRAAEAVGQLEALAAKSASVASPGLSPITRAGIDNGQLWAACRYVAGRTAAEWLVHNGRFPPNVVLEIARQMLAGLTALERAGICHGDISASGLILTDQGDAVLPHPGLRGLIRREEGFAFADLAPEAYEGLAPERIIDGTPPTTTGEVYACGALWWHLLAGRPPIPGGSSLAKLRAAATIRIPDVCQLAPDTPAALANVISRSVQSKPSLRPKSVAELAATLGPATRAGRRALSRCVSRSIPLPLHRRGPIRQATESKGALYQRLGLAGCIAVVAAVVWSFRPPGPSPPPASIPSKATRETPQPSGKPALGETSGVADGIREAPTHESGSVEPDRRDSPAQQPAARETASADAPDAIVLTARRVPLESLDLRAGQCIRGERGCRPTIVVPPGGYVVGVEGLRFEGLDFIGSDSTVAGRSGTAAAVIHVLVSRVEFRGCSFQGPTGATQPLAAVRWAHAPAGPRHETSLANGQLRLRDCVFRRVTAAVASQRRGARAVEMSNLLHLGTGPLIVLSRFPDLDEPVLINLARVTLRNTGPLLECRYQESGDPPGRISIQASDCAVAPRPDAALLSFVGPTDPERLLESVRWTGQGSLVATETVVAAWRGPDGDVARLDDALVSISGLVRSQVAYAGPTEEGPEASRITRWQAPSRAAGPPGIDPHTLAWPRP